MPKFRSWQVLVFGLFGGVTLCLMVGACLTTFTALGFIGNRLFLPQVGEGYDVMSITASAEVEGDRGLLRRRLRSLRRRLLRRF